MNLMRVFLCTPNSQRDTVEAILDRIGGAQNRSPGDDVQDDVEV